MGYQFEIKEKFTDELKKHSIKLLNPKTIQDKINWLKVYDSTPLKGKCADKIKSHEYCKEILGKDICIPILKVYNSVDDIKLSELPDKFVLKCNHGYHMNIICTDKSKFDLEKAKKSLKKWLNTDFGYESFQPHYSYIVPMVFAEKYMDDENQKESLFDYKFWCFNGQPKFFTINDDRGGGAINHYDMNGNPISIERQEYQSNWDKPYKKPEHFDEMVEYAKKLSKAFYFVRVDFYEINGKVYLGELTFTPGRGLFSYKSHEDEIKVGNMLKLPEPKKYEEGVSICLTGYYVQNFVEETLESIRKQTWFKNHDNWEILLGIDYCYETLKKVHEIMGKYKNLRVFMMKRNMGTYVTTNTMMSIAKYNGLIRFDCDDNMRPDMVESIMKEKGKADLVMFKMQNFGGRKNIENACGQIWVKHETFDKFGGYMPWSCSADAEFNKRLSRFVKKVKIDKVLLDRRIHSNNLTVAKTTNFSSPVRKKNNMYIVKITNRLRNVEDALMVKITNDYEEIFKDTNIEKYSHIKPKNVTVDSAEVKKNIQEKINRINIIKETIRTKKVRGSYGTNNILTF